MQFEQDLNQIKHIYNKIKHIYNILGMLLTKLTNAVLITLVRTKLLA